METELSKAVEESRGEMIETLRELVRIPSVRGEALPGKPFGEPAAEVLDRYLEIARAMGFTTRCVDHYVGTVDFGEGEPLLGILCHLDVVPAGDGWTVPPFELTERGDSLYGRGAIDDKGPATAALYALYALKRSGTPLRHAVRLIVGCDEECGSSDLAYYREHEALPRLLFTPDGDYPVINIEKGRVKASLDASFSATAAPRTLEKLDGGFVANAVPDRASAVLRGFSAEEVRELLPQDGDVTFTVTEQEARVTVEAQGVSAHASLPEKGSNALTALIRVLSAMPFGGCDGFDRLQALAHLFPHGETDGASAGLARRDERSGALTLAFDILHYDEESLHAELDIRFPVSETYEGVVTALREACGDVMEVTAEGSEPHYVSEYSDFVQTLLKVYEEQTGNEGYCVAIGGGTYVHEIPGGVAFGAEFPGEENHMHGADERIRTESLLLNARIFAHAVKALCE